MTRQQPRFIYGVAAGAVTLVAMAAAPFVVHYAVPVPKRLLILASLPLVIIVIYRGRAWLLPLFIGLVWTDIGASVFKLAAFALIAYGAWNAWSRPVTTRRSVLLMALFALPLVATSLLSPVGAPFPAEHLRYVLFIFVVALGIRSRREAEHAGFVLACVGVFLGLGAVFSILVGPDKIFPLAPDVTAARAAGPVLDPNFFALVLASLLPFAMEVYERGRSNRLVGLASALSIVAGVLATGSRGGLIACAVALLASVLLSKQRAARPLAVLVIVAGIALVPTVFAAQTTSSEQRSVSGRADENLIAIAMFRDHPVAGVGPDQYPLLFRDYARKIGNDPRTLRQPHSLPLQIAAGQGLVGIIAWITAATVLVGVARGGVLRQPIGAATVVALITYMTGSIFLHGSLLQHLYVLIGLLVAIAAPPGETNRPRAAFSFDAKRRSAVPIADSRS